MFSPYSYIDGSAGVKREGVALPTNTTHPAQPHKPSTLTTWPTSFNAQMSTPRQARGATPSRKAEIQQQHQCRTATDAAGAPPAAASEPTRRGGTGPAHHLPATTPPATVRRVSPPPRPPRQPRRQLPAARRSRRRVPVDRTRGCRPSFLRYVNTFILFGFLTHVHVLFLHCTPLNETLVVDLSEAVVDTSFVFRAKNGGCGRRVTTGPPFSRFVRFSRRWASRWGAVAAVPGWSVLLSERCVSSVFFVDYLLGVGRSVEKRYTGGEDGAGRRGGGGWGRRVLRWLELFGAA